MWTSGLCKIPHLIRKRRETWSRVPGGYDYITTGTEAQRWAPRHTVGIFSDWYMCLFSTSWHACMLKLSQSLSMFTVIWEVVSLRGIMVSGEGQVQDAYSRHVDVAQSLTRLHALNVSKGSLHYTMNHSSLLSVAYEPQYGSKNPMFPQQKRQL